jgi:hypothetical protein
MKENSDSNGRHVESRRSFIQKVGLGTAAFGLGNMMLKPRILTANPKELLKSAVPLTDATSKNNVNGPYGFDYFIGIVGDPSVPNISWSDNELTQIKALGVNMLQLSIAWGGRPANEVLNLEDLDSGQLAKWDFRVKQAKKFGFDTLAQFGIPKLLYTANGYSIVQPACILSPEVRDKYSKLLRNFLDRFPTVDNILVYTYDQDAWLCSEFGPCPRCSGIPLHERLADFLNFLKNTIHDKRKDVTVWWKPWEISNGTAIKIVQSVDASNFGLILNPSCANEVYPFNDRAFKSDLGIKRTVQVAADRKIPVIGEIDYTFYKGYYLIQDFFPRFVYEQLQGWKEMKGVVGIKEYFGFAPSQFSVNAEMLKACMKSPEATLEELLEQISEPYGKSASGHMREAWELVSRGVEAFPWDVTYLLGPLGLDKNNDGSHSWEPATISNSTWNTPAWKTNRRANFMMTRDFKAHPWVFEDLGLLLEDSANLLYEAVNEYNKAISAGSGKSQDIKTQRDAIEKIARAVRGTSLHFLETVAAQDARLVGYDPKQWRLVINRLDALLEKDVENQNGTMEVTQKLKEFQHDPESWLEKNLNPLAYESKCSIDWDKYVPYASNQG